MKISNLIITLLIFAVASTVQAGAHSKSITVSDLSELCAQRDGFDLDECDYFILGAIQSAHFLLEEHGPYNCMTGGSAGQWNFIARRIRQQITFELSLNRFGSGVIGGDLDAVLSGAGVGDGQDILENTKPGNIVGWGLNPQPNDDPAMFWVTGEYFRSCVLSGA